MPKAIDNWKLKIDNFVREALLQEKTNGKLRCNVCERRCTIVPDGRGWCRTRENRDGRLVTLIYGVVSSLASARWSRLCAVHAETSICRTVRVLAPIQQKAPIIP
jgi:hypothetical protein